MVIIVIIIQETNKLKIDLQIEEDNELAKIIRDQEEKNSNSYQYNEQYAKEEIYEEKKEFEVFSTHEENSKEIKKYEANPNKRKKNRCWEIKKILNIHYFLILSSNIREKYTGAYRSPIVRSRYF